METRDALIVAHGQPSDPRGPEAEIAALAVRVAALMPGWRVRGTTLATPGGIARAAEGLTSPVVFPFFMADGWFIRSELPRRLDAAGVTGARVQTPFGLLPDVESLAVAVLDEALGTRGWAPEETDLILAAHGSGRSRAPSEAAQALGGFIATSRDFAAVRLGFIEEPPFLAQALIGARERSLLLPLFVARWGHVEEDIPRAVAEAGFGGAVLPPLGSRQEVAGIIAEAIGRAPTS